MAGVIKAGQLEAQREREQSAQVFTLEDIQRKGDALLEKVRQQAEEILKQAKTEANSIRQQAAEDGKQDARQQAEAQVRAEWAEQAGTIMPAIEQVMHEVMLVKEDWKKRWNHSVLDLASAIASKIIRRELSQQPQISQTLLSEAVELAAGAKQIQVLFHPQDAESLAPLEKQLTAQFAPLGETIIQADPAIEPGFCKIRTEFGEIDQTLATQLERIVAELH